MLGLAEQVDRDDERVGVLVGDDQDLGRAGEQVDADLAEQLPLGLGDVRVAGAGEQVDLADGLGAERHRRDGLGAAEQEISSAPARCRAATVAAGISPRIGGVQAVTRSTPATLAVTTVMCADATSG